MHPWPPSTGRASRHGEKDVPQDLRSGVRQITIRTADLAASRAFYADRLGFSLLEEEQGRYAQLNLGTFRLRLEVPGADGPSSGRGTTLTFTVKNLARTGEELAARGIGYEARTSVRTGDYLETTDPDGYRIVFAERL